MKKDHSKNRLGKAACRAVLSAALIVVLGTDALAEGYWQIPDYISERGAEHCTSTQDTCEIQFAFPAYDCLSVPLPFACTCNTLFAYTYMTYTAPCVRSGGQWVCGSWSYKQWGPGFGYTCWPSLIPGS